MNAKKFTFPKDLLSEGNIGEVHDSASMRMSYKGSDEHFGSMTTAITTSRPSFDDLKQVKILLD